MKTRKLLLLAVLAAAYACGKDGVIGPQAISPPGTEPAVSGWLEIRLTSPNSDDGGIMFTVSGGPIDSLRSDHRSFSAAADDATWRVLLTGRLSNGVIAGILVPDVGAAARYRPEIQQVAALESYAQRPLDGYRLQIVRPSPTGRAPETRGQAPYATSRPR